MVLDLQVLALKASKPTPIPKKMLYISKLDPATTTEQVTEFISLTFNFKLDYCTQTHNKKNVDIEP